MNKRVITRQSHNNNEEGESYLVSVSDLMSGLIFLFIITLMVFSVRIKGTQEDLRQELEKAKREKNHWESLQKETEVKRLWLAQQKQVLEEEKKKLEKIVQYLTGGRAIRDGLLEDVQEKLAMSGFKVQIDLEHGILRLPEEVLFPSGSDELQPEGMKMLNILADIFSEVLPKYTISTENVGVTFPDIPKPAKIEAIFIEGHTDNVTVRQGSSFDDNWDLSTARAIKTFKTLLVFGPTLEQLKNENILPIFSVTGYADQRPVASNNTEPERKLNRRIDLRFIMTPPKATPDVIKALEESLTK